MSNMVIEYTFTLPREEARTRLQALGEYLTNRHHIKVTWDGDRAAVKGKYMVVTVEGAMILGETKVTFDGKDPGFLWRGKAKDYILGKMKKYLDPSATEADLPRR